MFRRALALLTALAVTSACSSGSSTDPRFDGIPSIAAGTVTARISNGSLVLQNQTEQVVRFVVHESVYHDQALALWCMGGEGCGTQLAQGQVVSVALSSIPGYNPASKEISVFWWRPGGAVERTRVALP